MADGKWVYRRTASKFIKVSILGRQKLELVGHALLQMSIRGISEQDVIRTIRNPTRTGLRTKPSRKRVRRHKSTYKAIDVVYEELPDRIRVITAIAITLRRPKK